MTEIGDILINEEILGNRRYYAMCSRYLLPLLSIDIIRSETFKRLIVPKFGVF